MPSESEVGGLPARRLLPGWRGCVGVAALVAVVWGLYQYQPYLSGVVLIYTLSALGLDWIMDRAGQVSLANAPLMAIGGFTSVWVARQPWGSLLLAMLASAFTGALVGYIIGLPALRVRGLYLVLTTLALQFIVADGLQLFEEHTGQVSGYQLPQAGIGGLRLDYDGSFVVFLTVFLVLVWVFLRGMYSGAPGRSWAATRENEVAASIMGLDVAAAKLVAFVGSSALISVSGCLLAYYTQQAAASTFTLDFAISFAVMLIIGGGGSFAGVFVGAIIVTLAPVAIQSLNAQVSFGSSIDNWLGTNIYLLSAGLYGLLVLVVLLFLPEGLVPAAVRTAASLVAQLQAYRIDSPGSALTQERVSISAEPGRDAQIRTRPLLTAAVSARYSNGASAVRGASIEVGRHEVVAILGRNGAGKTSLLRSIGGYFPSEAATVEGRVTFAGDDILGKRPHQIARYGMVLVPERDKVFPNLTVDEHLKLAAGRRWRTRLDELHHVLGPLAAKRGVPAGLLSGGQRQMLAVGMSLCRSPRLLMVDEFSLGLSPVATYEIGSLLRQVAADMDLSMLLVEQNTRAALHIADYIYVMDAGVIVAAGSRAEFETSDVLDRIYLGAAAQAGDGPSDG